MGQKLIRKKKTEPAVVLRLQAEQTSSFEQKDRNCDLVYTDPDHISEFDRKDLIELFKTNRLNIISSEYLFGFQRYCLKT